MTRQETSCHSSSCLLTQPDPSSSFQWPAVLVYTALFYWDDKTEGQTMMQRTEENGTDFDMKVLKHTHQR